MKGNWSWSLWKHLILSVGIYLVYYIFQTYYISKPDAASIGIIGGSDGPTSVYIAGKIGPYIKSVAISMILLIASVVTYKPLKKKLEKRK